MTISSSGSEASGEPRRYFFVHIPKTAGTTLFARLRNQFGYMGVYPMPQYEGDIETSIGIDVMLERFALHPQIRVITGHFPLCAAEMLDVPVTTFTLLRDPVERVLSFLRQQQRDATRYAGCSLEQIYDDRDMTWTFLTNFAVRQFSLDRSELTEGPKWTDEERVERAKLRLVEKVDLVGIQEDFEGFCNALTVLYGWDLGDPMTRNVTEPVDTPQSLRDRIREDNRHDDDLYRFAVRLWEQRTSLLRATSDADGARSGR